MEDNVFEDSFCEEEEGRDSFLQPPTRSLRNFALVGVRNVKHFFMQTFEKRKVFGHRKWDTCFILLKKKYFSIRR